MSQFPFRPAQNAEPAQFIVEGIKGFGVNINSIIPQGFEAYVRIFHPATLVKDSCETHIRWSVVAQHTGQPFHKQMQWWQLSGQESPASSDDILLGDSARIEPPEEGSIPFAIVRELWPLLRKHTGTPENCFFAIWAGFGGLAQFVRKAPSFELSARKFYLFEAPIQTIEKTFWSYDGDTPSHRIISDFSVVRATPEEVHKTLSEHPSFYQSANLWWPADELWCVATEIDFNSTLVAGSQKVIDTVISHGDLEAYQLEPTDSFWGTNK